MKKLKVRSGACIGCGTCIALDPNHFDFNDEGLAEVINSEDLENNALLNALESCPTNAIHIKDCDKDEEEDHTCHCTSGCTSCPSQCGCEE